MKHKTLLLFAACAFAAGANAQKRSKPVTAYAITAVEKGSSRWTEVRLIDVTTGEEIKRIYESAKESTPLNARTGKEVIKKELQRTPEAHKIIIIQNSGPGSTGPQKIIESAPDRIRSKEGEYKTEHLLLRKEGGKIIKEIRLIRTNTRSNVPFATSSAACAYDKKNDRLYFTPMGISQLRYIDLKTNKIYYFEEEQFGSLSNPGDVPNQITRMTMGEDGFGYALTNNGEHLIRFSTNKKSEIADLGGLSDNAGNKNNSIHNHNNYGGDIVADNSGKLYLITANRSVFAINIKSREAIYLGAISGLPNGFTTNGTVAEKGSNIIVTSSTSTQGYYVVDLNTLQAQKTSSSAQVYNASDLANGNLVSARKVKEDKEVIRELPMQETITEVNEPPARELAGVNETNLNIYPNPVTNGLVNLSFTGYSNGRYELQLLDLAGKMLQTQQVTISGKSQVQEMRLPATIAKGSYLIKVMGESGKQIHAEKLIVQ